MSSSDMAKVGCNDCRGCSSCCRDRAEAITLDEWDVQCLKDGLGLTFEQLLDRELLVLTLVDGVLLPSLGKKSDADVCIFLGDDGRCEIHNLRPGICRMFPLARLYHEDGSFSYFIQEGECEHNNGVKIKISKWLGIPNIAAYENTVRDYHDRLKALCAQCAAATSREQVVALQKKFLEDNFVKSHR